MAKREKTARRKPAGISPALFFIRDAYRRFIGNRVTLFSASLSYLTVFAVGPLSVMTMLIIESVLRDPESRMFVLSHATDPLGPSAMGIVNSFLLHFRDMQKSTVLTAISVIILLFIAISFFSNLRSSLNIIFGMDRKRSIGQEIAKRLLSVMLIAGAVAVLVVSLLLNTVIVKVDNAVAGSAYISSYIMSPVYFAASAAIIALFFASIYRFLPDRRIRWRCLLAGASFSAILFTFGKSVFEWYLGGMSFTTIYGAAGSVMIIMLWVYYSAMIFYSGAVFAKSLEETQNEFAGGRRRA